MRWLAALGVSAVAALAATVGAAASGPYTGTGYDAASGQCGATPPAGSSFGVINVTHGRPFTTNTCAPTEAGAAQQIGAQVSLYFNTGYSGAYGQDITCTATGGHTGKLAQAYQIGCSEAAYAARAAAGVTQPVSGWWLDVETGNSWSSSNKGYNVATIQGALDEMHGLSSAPVGVYSSPSMWQTITGGAAFTGLDASWVAGGGCSASFSGSPAWIVQGAAAGGFDIDTAC